MKAFNKTDVPIVIDNYRILPNDSIEITKEEMQILMNNKEFYAIVKELLSTGKLTITI